MHERQITLMRVIPPAAPVDALTQAVEVKACRRVDTGNGGERRNMKYQIKGEPMPVVICQLEDGESVICESGAMSWMSPNLEMETSGGGAGKVFGRMFSGEGMFQNRYTARKGAGMIAFASKFPGDIRAVEITRDSPVICQKGAFLASTEGVELSVAFQQKFSVWRRGLYHAKAVRQRNGIH